MKYKFRLVFYHEKPGFFHIDKEFLEYSLTDMLQIKVCPRNSDTLLNATKYHIDGGGFLSEIEARNSGEKLRIHLRMLNCILNLHLLIPNSDSTSGSVSEGIKSKIRQSGGELMDTIVGLHVYPDDDIHMEHVMSGVGKVYPSDPLYVLKGLKDSWSNTFSLNESTAEVIEILNISVREGSPKVRFLTTYLAMEQIIKRKMRSQNACELIDGFISMTEKSGLTDIEKKSLSGSLGYLKEQSFSSAFSAFSRQVISPETISGMSVKKFVSACISLRNKIAHNAAIESTVNIDEYTNHLRQMAMSVLWKENDLPNISVYRPADQITMEKMEIRAM